MRKITVLEPNIANKIAAGEVVERPASIVKELVENSIDAGSTAITVEIRNGGIDYIRITDNGSGIPADEAEIAFLRHATSKLASADELSHIETLGFRGEALASIAAVAKVSMRTRTQDGECGTHIDIEGGRMVFCDPCGCPCGTTIEVNELFYNVPARLKFLKSSRGEAAMIGDYILRLILANPSIAIKFINNGKTVYHSAGDGSLENALFCVYGAEIVSRLYKVHFDDGYLKLTGYVGSESLAKSTRSQQSFFVNRRYVKVPVVSLGVQRAFDTRLMHGKFPFFVLNMTISSYEIDVNVHPNKLSVRFKDEERIGFAVTRAVCDAMNGINVTADNDIDREQDREENSDTIKDTSFKRILSEQPKSHRPIKQSELYELFGNPEKNLCRNSDLDENSESSSSDSAKKTDSLLSHNCTTTLGRTSDTNYKDALGFSSSNDQATELVFNDSGGSSFPSFDYELPRNMSYGRPDAPNLKDFKVDSALKNGNDAEIDKMEMPDSRRIENHAENSEVPPYEAAKHVDSIGACEDDKSIPVFNKEKTKQVNILGKPEQIKLDKIPYTVIGAAFDTYIIVQQGDAIYYIDQHAAHERIIYEELTNDRQPEFKSQLLLVPQIMKLDTISVLKLADNIAKFEQFGFSLTLVDETTIRIDAVPDILKNNFEGFIVDVIAKMDRNNGTGLSETELIREELIQASCKRAVKAGDRLENQEIERILDSYISGEIPLTCPHGRPVIIKVTKSELQRKFKRIL